MTGDIEQAQKHFPAVLEMEAPEDLREMAARELKPGGRGRTAVISLLDALRLFRGKSLHEVQEITFEIGMLGQHAQDITTPQESHVLRALPGRTFLALELLCIMYAGFKLFEPGMDIGVDPLARSGRWLGLGEYKTDTKEPAA